jgi:hypothetical protein
MELRHIGEFPKNITFDMVMQVKVAKNRDDRVHHLTEFGLSIQGKK